MFKVEVRIRGSLQIRSSGRLGPLGSPKGYVRALSSGIKGVNRECRVCVCIYRGYIRIIGYISGHFETCRRS